LISELLVATNLHESKTQGEKSIIGKSGEKKMTRSFFLYFPFFSVSPESSGYFREIL
jgi:hypothetical protein